MGCHNGLLQSFFCDETKYITTSAASATSNTFGSMEIYIPNYTASTNKPINHISVSENNAQNAEIYVDAHLWRNSATVTSIKIYPSSGSFVSGSRFDLYGIKNS